MIFLNAFDVFVKRNDSILDYLSFFEGKLGQFSQVDFLHVSIYESSLDDQYLSLCCQFNLHAVEFLSWLFEDNIELQSRPIVVGHHIDCTHQNFCFVLEPDNADCQAGFIIELGLVDVVQVSLYSEVMCGHFSEFVVVGFALFQKILENIFGIVELYFVVHVVDADVGALSDLLVVGGDVIIAFLLVIEEKPDELGMLLSGLFAIFRVCIHDQILTELIRDAKTIAENLNCCVIFVFVD